MLRSALGFGSPVEYHVYTALRCVRLFGGRTEQWAGELAHQSHPNGPKLSSPAPNNMRPPTRDMGYVDKHPTYCTQMKNQLTQPRRIQALQLEAQLQTASALLPLDCEDKCNTRGSIKYLPAFTDDFVTTEAPPGRYVVAKLANLGAAFKNGF